MDPQTDPQTALEPGSEPTEFCPWCREDKPISEWYGPPPAEPEDGGDGNPEDAVPALGTGPIVCADCRRGQPPDGDAMLAKLPMVQRKILKALMGGASFYEAARAAGVSLAYPGNLLRGRNPKDDSRAIREVFQMLLEMEGLDIFSIARQTRLLFKAQKAMWNADAKRWDWFPDNNAQLGALRHLTKLMNLDPPKLPPGTPGSGSPIVVNIQTNLGDKGPGDPPGTYTVEVASAAELEPEQLEAGTDAG